MFMNGPNTQLLYWRFVVRKHGGLYLIKEE